MFTNLYLWSKGFTVELSLSPKAFYIFQYRAGFPSAGIFILSLPNLFYYSIQSDTTLIFSNFLLKILLSYMYTVYLPFSHQYCVSVTSHLFSSDSLRLLLQ